MTHDLKTWPVFFGPIDAGQKTFEVRKNDRNFALGDILNLREFEPTAGRYTDRTATFRITYILSQKDLPDALQPGYVVLGIDRLRDAASVPGQAQAEVPAELAGERITAKVIDQTPATQTVEDTRGERHTLTGDARDWKAGVDDVGTLTIFPDGTRKFRA